MAFGETDGFYMPYGDGLVQDFHLFPQAAKNGCYGWSASSAGTLRGFRQRSAEPRNSEMQSPQRGTTTGGTCTDAVLYDLETNRVLGQSKAMTTHYNLSEGILNALDKLDPVLCRKAETAGLSATLATNACVEGKFRKTGLLLMGIDREGVAKYGAEYGFTDPDALRYLACRTTITGQILEEHDWEMLRENGREWFSDAEYCAVCEIHGMRIAASGRRKQHKSSKWKPACQPFAQANWSIAQAAKSSRNVLRKMPGAVMARM